MKCCVFANLKYFEAELEPNILLGLGFQVSETGR